MNRRAAQAQPNGHAGGGAGAAAVAAASGLVSFVGAAARLVQDTAVGLIFDFFFVILSICVYFAFLSYEVFSCCHNFVKFCHFVAIHFSTSIFYPSWRTIKSVSKTCPLVCFVVNCLARGVLLGVQVVGYLKACR